MTLLGLPPVHYKPYTEADACSKEELIALLEVCQSMHMVMPRGDGPTGTYISSKLNPAELVCTCKGFKVSSNCSHEVSVTALYLTDAECVPGKTSFDREYLETLLEKVSTVTRRASRPRNTVPGNRIQPTDDTVEAGDNEEDEGEEEDVDEVLDDM